MNTNTSVIFTKDTANRKITVIREFAAPRTRVWAAWTKGHLLDEWWAPKPWLARTVSMDFRVGGYWLYYMLGLDGSKIYARVDYQTIDAENSFTVLDAFCDEAGNINMDFARMHWTNTFTDNGAHTRVNIEIDFEKEEDLQKIIEMGFEEGFKMGLDNLEELLKNNIL